MDRTYRLPLLMLFMALSFTSYASAHSDTLTFRLVHADNDMLCDPSTPRISANTKGYTCFNKGDMAYWISNKIVLGYRDVRASKVMMTILDAPSGKWKQVEVDLGTTENAYLDSSATNGVFTVEICFNKSGQNKLRILTKYNQGRRLAIMLNGELISAPVIKEQIRGGEMSVVGLSFDEAKSLKEATSRTSR
jgi:preprotein translocase subunit SecD